MSLPSATMTTVSQGNGARLPQTKAASCRSRRTWSQSRRTRSRLGALFSAELGREGTHVLHHARTKALEQGDELVPNARSQESRAPVRRVHTVRDVVASHVGVDVGSPGQEHRANPP